MDELFDTPPVRIGLVILSVGIASGLLPLLYLLDLPIDSTLLKWLILLFSGIWCGSAVRFFLGKSPLVLQYMTALSAVLVNSFILGRLTMNLVGFNWDRSSDPHGYLIWSVQLVLVCVIAWMMIRVWNPSVRKIRIPKKVSEPGKQPAHKPKRRSHSLSQNTRTRNKGKSTRSGLKVHTKQIAQKKSTRREVLVIPAVDRQHQVERPRLSRLKSWENRFHKLWQKARMYRNDLDPSSRISTRRLVKTRQPKLRRSPRIENNNVRFSGEVEHRCPYCLEIVQRKDPRGVKICPICQTHHHLDCWNITGVCQVPHQSE